MYRKNTNAEKTCVVLIPFPGRFWITDGANAAIWWNEWDACGSRKMNTQCLLTFHSNCIRAGKYRENNVNCKFLCCFGIILYTRILDRKRVFRRYRIIFQSTHFLHALHGGSLLQKYHGSIFFFNISSILNIPRYPPLKKKIEFKRKIKLNEE